MISHIIYHIPSRKVGCTRDLDRRKREYPKGTKFEVLETLHDKTDQEAGDIEWKWAAKLGYKKGHHFTHLSPKDSRKGGIRAGERGKSGFQTMSVENRSEFGRQGGLVGGRVAAELGITPFHTMRPDQRKLNGSKGGNRSVELGTGIHGLSRSERVENSRKGGLIGGFIGGKIGGRKGGLKTAERRNGPQYQISQCPHCGLEGKLPAMHRWHHDNCPKKKTGFARGN
jgi:hypothetical protein